MNKLILILLICGGAVFGGKLYLENKYEKELDKAINLARSEVDISYSKLKIGFDGSINIHDISFRVVDDAGSFTIKKLSAISSNQLAPLYGNIFKDGESPEWLKMSLNQLTIDSVLVEPDTADECSTFENAYVFSEIGITQIFSNMTIELDFKDPENSEAAFYYEDQTSTLDLLFNFSIRKAQQSFITQDIIPINNIRLSSFVDPDFATQFNDYCAKKLNMTTEKYLSEVIASPKYSYESFGYNFGDKASEALAAYMKGGHNFTVSSAPSESIKKVSNFNVYNRQQIVRELNLKFKLDDKSILVKSNTKNDFNEIEEKDEPLVIRGKRLKYQPSSVANIPNLIDKKVKIWRKNKNRIDGRINRYANGIAFIEIRKSGGKAIYEIKTSEIQKIEVLR